MSDWREKQAVCIRVEWNILDRISYFTNSAVSDSSA